MLHDPKFGGHKAIDDQHPFAAEPSLPGHRDRANQTSPAGQAIFGGHFSIGTHHGNAADTIFAHQYCFGDHEPHVREPYFPGHLRGDAQIYSVGETPFDGQHLYDRHGNIAVESSSGGRGSSDAQHIAAPRTELADHSPHAAHDRTVGQPQLRRPASQRHPIPFCRLNPTNGGEYVL